jgi:membrane protein
VKSVALQNSWSEKLRRKWAGKDHHSPRAVALGVWDEFFEDSIPTVAGGITFFLLLALFPTLSLVVSLYGLVADRGEIARQLNAVSAFLPAEAMTVLGDELKRLAAAKPQVLGLNFLASLIVALWGASGGFKALVGGLNVAFEVSETRGFLRLSLNALVFTLAGILFAVVAINMGVVIPHLIERWTDTAAMEWLLKAAAWPISFLATSLILALVYRFGPDRDRPKWIWISWGSAIATILWLAATQLFILYAGTLAHYDQTYGTLGALIGFLVWLWLSLIIVLLGAEINSELELGQIKRRRRAGKKHPEP